MIVSNPELFIEVKKYLSQDQQELIEDVEIVLKRIELKDHISDYSFLVAPVAKAYEGFVKDFFLKIGLISDNDYESDRFRVGKTLNPSLRYKRFSIFQKLADFHQDGEELAESLWDAWKYGRNEIFHYFPNDLKKLSQAEAEDRISLLLRTINRAGQFLDQNQKNIVQ